MKTICMLALAFSASAALAEGPLNYPDPDTGPLPIRDSGLTRAAVIADFIAYRDNGLAPEPPSNLTRAHVQAEFTAARPRGEMAMLGEDSGSMWLAQVRSGDAIRLAARGYLALATTEAVLR